MPIATSSATWLGLPTLTKVRWKMPPDGKLQHGWNLRF